MAEFEKMKYEWNENLTSDEWDGFLSQFHGHPLQSTKWGDAKKLSCGIHDHRWIAFKNGTPYFMARFEERWLFKLLKIAWIPKGPVILDKHYESTLHKEFLSRLKKRGFFLCATNPWEKIEFMDKINSAFHTIWLDLTIKKEKLWENLHKKCRSDIKRAKKLGVLIEKSKSLDDLNLFYQVCESISKSKGFSLSTSLQLMSYLLSSDHDQVESYLFVARHEGHFCGGAFLMRCGESVHYLWGAVNRDFAHLCIGEALQWEIIEWAISKNCKKYDLEGISAKQNGGVDKFKKKLGGTVIAYPSIQIYPLHTGRKIIICLTKIYLFLQPKMTRVCRQLLTRSEKRGN